MRTKPHFYKHKGYWRCEKGSWIFTGDTWQRAYANFKLWDNYHGPKQA